MKIAVLLLASLPALTQSAPVPAPTPASTPAPDSPPASAPNTASAPVAVPTEPQPIGFSEVIELPGKTKADLFAAARSWFVDTFKDSKNVIEVNDESRGEITAK